MRSHIQGLEKEYGVSPDFFLSRPFSRTLLFDCASRYLMRVKGQSLSHDYWLSNMGRLYMDTGSHIEYASPECETSRDVLIWQKAGDEILIDAVEGVNDLLWQALFTNDGTQLFDREVRDDLRGYVVERHLKPGAEIIRLYRNSIDICGRHMYGEHENHLVRRESVSSPHAMSNFQSILLVHLISRIIWQGSGIVHWRGGHSEYRLSQRELGTGELILCGTTGEFKPLINTRDESHARSDKWYRVHIVGGDANLAEVSSRLKFGTTALIVRMIEDGCLDGKVPIYRLDEMRDAYSLFSGDRTLRKIYKFSNGNYSALDLQLMFLGLAEEYVGKGYAERTPDILWTLEWWRKILDLIALDDPHEKLARYTDVSAKLFLILRDMEKYGYSWRSSYNDCIKILKKDGSLQLMTVGGRLGFWELEYHRLSRTQGIFQKLSMERIVSSGEVAFAKENPPHRTRAETRRKYCDYLKKLGGSVDSMNWNLVKGRDNNGDCFDFVLDDPFARFTKPQDF